MHDRPVRFYVMIARPAYETLYVVAKKERRSPQDQAAVLLEEMLTLIEQGPQPAIDVNGAATEVARLLEPEA